MGAEVAGVPGGTPVGDAAAGTAGAGAAVAAGDAAGFGRWLERERTIRGVSLEYVAVRVKSTPERIRAIEQGRLRLHSDLAGRGTARALARVIGADPEEGAARIAEDVPRPGLRGAPATLAAVRTRLWLWAQIVLLVSVVAAGLLGLSFYLERPPRPDELPRLRVRTDYVGALTPAGKSAGKRLAVVELRSQMSQTSRAP